VDCFAAPLIFPNAEASDGAARQMLVSTGASGDSLRTSGRLRGGVSGRAPLWLRAFLFLGGRQWATRPTGPEGPTAPAWMSSIDSFTF
jgi:hypothetical protein